MAQTAYRELYPLAPLSVCLQYLREVTVGWCLIYRSYIQPFQRAEGQVVYHDVPSVVFQQNIGNILVII